ncbi:MAG: hypothetical protein ACLSVD_00355 [Eggerthellaceae bacterium]
MFAKNRDFSVSVAHRHRGTAVGLQLRPHLPGDAAGVQRRGRLGTLLGFTGALALVFVLRLLIYGYGYVRGQIGGAQVSRNLRQYLGDKIKRIPRGSPSGRAATTSTRSPRT